MLLKVSKLFLIMYVFVGLDCLQSVGCYSIVSIAKWLQARWSGGLKPCEVEIVSIHPDQLWGLPSFLYYGYGSVSCV
jgi:hypothetical protein